MSGERNAARARVYRLLARVFQQPGSQELELLRRDDLPLLGPALAALAAPPDLVEPAAHLVDGLARTDVGTLQLEYEKAFEPSGGQSQPPNETAHAPETPQEGLARTFELADIAGFYRAFGVEVTPGSERVDHIAVELEFMHLLAVKEAVAEERGESENAELCRDAAEKFLNEHLARWCPKLRDRLRESAPGPVYRAAGEVLARFVDLDVAGASPA